MFIELKQLSLLLFVLQINDCRKLLVGLPRHEIVICRKDLFIQAVLASLKWKKGFNLSKRFAG